MTKLIGDYEDRARMMWDDVPDGWKEVLAFEMEEDAGKKSLCGVIGFRLQGHMIQLSTS